MKRSELSGNVGSPHKVSDRALNALDSSRCRCQPLADSHPSRGRSHGPAVATRGEPVTGGTELVILPPTRTQPRRRPVGILGSVSTRWRARTVGQHGHRVNAVRDPAKPHWGSRVAARCPRDFGPSVASHGGYCICRCPWGGGPLSSGANLAASVIGPCGWGLGPWCWLGLTPSPTGRSRRLCDVDQDDHRAVGVKG